MSGVLSQDSISLTRRPLAGVRFCYLATPSGGKAGTQRTDNKKKRERLFYPSRSSEGETDTDEAATCSETF